MSFSWRRRQRPEHVLAPAPQPGVEFQQQFGKMST